MTLEAWERMETEWEAKVDGTVARMEALALVRVVQVVVEHRMRELRAAEYEVQLAMQRALHARNELDAARTTLEDALKLASRDV